jgi:hypothetical protein
MRTKAQFPDDRLLSTGPPLLTSPASENQERMLQASARLLNKIRSKDRGFHRDQPVPKIVRFRGQ